MKHHFFTFGSDHLDGRGLDQYVEIAGDVDDLQARQIMIALFDVHWSSQYSEQEWRTARWLVMRRHMLVTVVKS